MVVYDKYLDSTVVINVKKLKKINIYNKGYMQIMREISIKAKTIEELSMSLNITNSAVSRRLQKLLTLGIITRTGIGTRNYPYIHSLNEFGWLLLG